jgi:hypothetical protein
MVQKNTTECLTLVSKGLSVPQQDHQFYQNPQLAPHQSRLQEKLRSVKLATVNNEPI